MNGEDATLLLASSSFVDTAAVPIVVALIGLTGTLVAAVLTYAFGRLSEAASRRREGYAEASRLLVRWAEFPYRIRRRTSDSPEELARLAHLGHEIQEELSFRTAWVSAENARMGEILAQVIEDLRAEVGRACQDAWTAPPIAAASGMNLNGWGPQGTDEPICRFQSAVRFRFGWRRLPARFGIRVGIHARPEIKRDEEQTPPLPSPPRAQAELAS